jgi:hypothetical protein
LRPTLIPLRSIFSNQTSELSSSLKRPPPAQKDSQFSSILLDPPKRNHHQIGVSRTIFRLSTPIRNFTHRPSFSRWIKYFWNYFQPKYHVRDRVYFSLHRDRVQSNLDEETSNLVILNVMKDGRQTIRVSQLLHGLQERFP